MSAKVNQYDVLEVEVASKSHGPATYVFQFKYQKDEPQNASIYLDSPCGPAGLPVDVVHQAMAVFQDIFPFVFEEKAE